MTKETENWYIFQSGCFKLSMYLKKKNSMKMFHSLAIQDVQ